MMLPHRFHQPARALAACALLALSGCASKELNRQLANTRIAVDQAHIAGAAEVAPAEFQAASDKLQRAETAANDRKKKDAMRLAEQAQADANLARARTDSAQARVAAAEMAKSNSILSGAYNR
ncbi:MAG: DUF4398 domain-containing protein [Lysobacteraceae bacterium]|nr:MAG: DUF4398 domain-containing protein [Xanthomonadaceae bacterium]